MTPRPELSIVVPAYNEEAVIGQLVASVQAEVPAHAADWELLVVDDGSVDRTAALVAEQSAMDPRVRVVPGAHKGDRKSTRLNTSHIPLSRMPSSA